VKMPLVWAKNLSFGWK